MKMFVLALCVCSMVCEPVLSGALAEPAAKSAILSPEEWKSATKDQKERSAAAQCAERRMAREEMQKKRPPYVPPDLSKFKVMTAEEFAAQLRSAAHQ
jgi:hypothetical protein